MTPRSGAPTAPRSRSSASRSSPSRIDRMAARPDPRSDRSATPARRSRLGWGYRLLPMGVVFALLLGSCVSTAQAPASLDPGGCSLEPGLAGVWQSARSSQLGPAAMTFRFDCDCTYVARVRLLFRTVRERGAYWVEDDRLLLSRASGEVTSWPFELDGDELSIREHEDETHVYERKATYRCANP